MTRGPDHAVRRPEAVPRSDAAAEPVPAAAAAVVVPGLLEGTSGLLVGRADDASEVEAEQVARDVVRFLAGRSDLGAAPSGGGHGTPAPGCVHRSVDGRAAGAVGAAGGPLDPTSSASLVRQQGSGAPMSRALRAPMEAALGADLGGVRLHTGAVARSLNEGMQAEAFTLGKDIFFRDGVPDTRSAPGQRLLAHELTHTLQGDPEVGRTLRRTLFATQERTPLLVGPSSDGPGKRRKGKAKAADTDEPEDASDGSEGSDEAAADEGVDWSTAEALAEQAGVDLAPLKEAVELLTTVRDHELTTLARGLLAPADKAVAGGASATASGSAVTASSAAGSAAASATRGKTLKEGLKVLAKLSGTAEASLDASALAVLKLGSVTATLTGKLHAVVSARAHVDGEATLNTQGLSASFDAAAVVEASATASVSADVTFKDVAVRAKVDAFAKATVGVKAKGTLTLTKTGVGLQAGFSAFAGVKAGASASTSVEVGGKTLWKVDVKVSANAGVGAEGNAGFTLENGVLTITIDLQAALGLGIGAGGTVQIDLQTIGEMLALEVEKALLTSPKSKGYRGLVSQDAVWASLRADLEKYAKKKQTRGSRLIKPVRVNEIVAAHGKARGLAFGAQEDEDLVDLVNEVFGAKVDGVTAVQGTVAFEQVGPRS